MQNCVDAVGDCSFYFEENFQEHAFVFDERECHVKKMPGCLNYLFCFCEVFEEFLHFCWYNEYSRINIDFGIVRRFC